MTKADLHCHSKYSDKPSTWFLKAYDSPESFTEPETLYQQAKSRGMDWVTITDHDDIRGCLELQRHHPEDTFISCEVTAWFPEDGCKVHILVYGIDVAQYRQLMQRRHDIYALRDFIFDRQIAHSVAHASYDQDGKLTMPHIEKLALLFDVFEVVNGGVSKQNSTLVHRYLESLDAPAIGRLRARHQIQPIGEQPWIKGYTGGSDDHCGILIGSAYTESDSSNKSQFLDHLRGKATTGRGLHGSFEIYATGVIKHIHDYRNHRDSKYKKSKMNDFLEMFFTGNEGNWIRRFKKSHSLRYLKRKNNKTHSALHELLEQINQTRHADIAKKIPLAYRQVAHLHDQMFRTTVKALVKNLPKGNIFKTFEHLSNLFPMLVLAAPFVGSMRHQVLKAGIKESLLKACQQHYTRKTLWFTDTIDDLNGVSVSLRQIAAQAVSRGYHLTLVGCLEEEHLNSPLPENCINLPPVCCERVPGYEQQKIGFPSLLGMMQRIIVEQPDQIIVSTPGPVGLGAMLCAKLMDLPLKAIYHTDFAEQLLRMSNEPMLANMVDYATNAFYKQADHVYVPSQAYISKLSNAGLERSKMHLFPRGIDTQLYAPTSDNPASPCLPTNLGGSFSLLYAGRVSKDKNLELLAQIVELANQQHPGRYNLIIAGDGPYLDELKQRLNTQANTHFTGRVDSAELVCWYQAADLLLFPSHTDTFGMVVLEAQSCATPCLVSNTGGPKEIIDNNQTGQIVYTDAAEDWFTVIQNYYRMRLTQPAMYKEMLATCRNRVLRNNSWQHVFNTVLGTDYCQSPQPMSEPSTTLSQSKAA